MLSPDNTAFQPPIPDNITVNDGYDFNLSMNKTKTYRIRLINVSALSSAMIHFDSHNMSVIMIDGQYVKRQDANQLRAAAGQRYDFLLTANANDTGNYPYLISLDLNEDYTNTTVTQRWAFNHTGYLITDSSASTTKKDVVQA